MRIRDWITTNIFASVPILGPYLRHDMQTATSEAIKCVIVLICENLGMYLIGHVHTQDEVVLNTAAMVGGVTAGTIIFNCGKEMTLQFQKLRSETPSIETGVEEQVQLVRTAQTEASTHAVPGLTSV